MSLRQRRPKNAGEWDRIVAYLPKELAQRLKQKADLDQRSVSSYITNLVMKDLEKWPESQKDTAT